MKKTASTLLGVLLMIGTASCQNAKDTHKQHKEHNSKNTQHMQRYSWMPSANGPVHYPVEVYSGYFYEDDNLALIADGSFLNNGWGTRGAEMASTNIVPNGLKITWFSFRENKFYTGDFKLPQDTITSLFKQGFIDYNTKKWTTYDAVVANMAPGGVVGVWMLGTSQCAVEIGRYQAEVTEVNWKEFLPSGTQDRQKYIKAAFSDEPEVLSDLDKDIRYDIWDKYRVKYNWRLVAELPKGWTIDQLPLEMFNGEKELLFDDELKTNPFKMRAVPSKIVGLGVDVPGTKGFGVDIYFTHNEAEIFEAFKLIYDDDKQQEAELVFRYNEGLKKFSIYLRSKTEEIEIRKTHQAF